MQATGVENYANLKLDNISFIDNKCDSLYGGGIGIKFIEPANALFAALQNISKSRPSLNGKEYFKW